MAARPPISFITLITATLLAVAVMVTGAGTANAEAENAPDGSGRRAAEVVATGEDHTCAVLDDDTVKCWGRNDFGQLGLGDAVNRGDNANEMGTNLPAIDLGPGRTAATITAGGSHSCALLDNGTVKCWGNNGAGQLGQGDTDNRGDNANEIGTNLAPVDLGPGRTATALSAGEGHSCALLDNGTVKCWGNNGSGQLGLGDTARRGDAADEMGANLTAIDLGPGRTATAVTAGGNHTCALLDNGTVRCWGFNFFGQLGRGDTDNRGDNDDEMGANLAPVDLGPGRTATAITAGGDDACALLDNGTVKCWGNNDFGQLGQGDTDKRGDSANEMGTNLPAIELGPGRTATAITAGLNHTCALLDDNTVKCWGFNTPGTLGQGDTANRGDNANEMGATLRAVELGSPTRSLPPPCPTTPHGFTDVPTSSFAFADIACIKGLGITTGTTPTTYNPAGNVTREQMAAFLARLWRSLDNTCAATPTGFTDVAASSFAFADIACIKALGITTGTTPTTYDPAGNVTREQMAAFLARLWRSLHNTCPTSPTGFTDVSSSSFAFADIACIKGLGITTGTTPTTYNPAGNVTREQMAAFLARLWRTNRGDTA